MKELRCLKRVENGLGIMSVYHMCDSDGIVQIIPADKLKIMIRTRQVRCINLTLTKDDKLRFKSNARVEAESDLEQLNCHLMRQKLMGLPPDAEYVVNSHGRVVLKAVFVQDGTYTIPSFVSEVYKYRGEYSPFYSCRRLKLINKSKITNMRRLFYSSPLEELDLTEFDTSQVTDMSEMFLVCGKLVRIKGKLNTSSVISMANMFGCCWSLEEVDVSDFDTSHVTSMHGMFSNCGCMKAFDFSRWDVSSVTDMQYMFSFCQRLKKLDLRSFHIPPETKTEDMFNMCSARKLLSPELKAKRANF